MFSWFIFFPFSHTQDHLFAKEFQRDCLDIIIRVVFQIARKWGLSDETDCTFVIYKEKQIKTLGLYLFSICLRVQYDSPCAFGASLRWESASSCRS